MRITKMADSPRKVNSSSSVHYNVCRCCNDNVFEKKHPVDLYGPKAQNESIVNLLEKLTGFKCDIADGLPTKICRPCYDKVIKFKKFTEMFDRSTVQQRSVIRVKRCRGEDDSPSIKGRLRKKVAETGRSAENSAPKSAARISLFPSTPRPILPAPSVPTHAVSEPATTKQRVLPRGIFPKPPKPPPKAVVILSQSGLRNSAVSLNVNCLLFNILDLHHKTWNRGI